MVPTQDKGNRTRIGDRNGEIKEKEREPPSAKDNVGKSSRECLVKDELRPRRNQTLATRVTFTDLVMNGLSYIPPRRSHYSSSRR